MVGSKVGRPNGVHKYLGKVYKSKNYGEFKVIEYNNANDLTVEFLKTGYKTKARTSDLRKNQVKDLLGRSVLGVGYLGEKYGLKIDKHIYQIWKGILGRCYDKAELEKKPTYRGCSVSEHFQCYSNFHEWCQHQIGFGNDGWQLDKDLLIKGNKVYSEDTCVFIPQEVNNLLTKRQNFRGDLPIGVHKKKRGDYFVSQINRDREKVFLGHFKEPISAFLAYKEAKEDYMKVVAEKWHSKIDRRAYEALMNYQVEITD